MKYLLCYENGNLSRYDKWNVEGLVHHHVRFTYPLADGRMLLCNIIHHLGYFDTDKMRFKLLNDQLPELERYRRYLSDLRRRKEHVLSPAEEKLLLNEALR